MDRNARDFEDLARGKKQYDTDGQPTGHINLFRNDANSTRWVSAGGTADVRAGSLNPTGFSETTFLSSNYALLHRINAEHAPQEWSYTGALHGGFYDSRKAYERKKALQSKCINSNSCAAGYSCISGQCTKIWGKDPSKVDSCGDLSVNWPCASKSDPGTSKCGNNSGPGSCQEQICGTGVDSRCCRAAKDGQVNCFCRACGDEGQCDPFCDTFNKTHGQPGPGCTPAGNVHAGFCNKDVCSECQTCTANIFGGGNQCEKTTSGAPCWCEGAGCDENGCEKCNKDKDSSSYGQCEYSWEGCQDCCIQYNATCPCNTNINLGTVQTCVPHPDPNFSSSRESCFTKMDREINKKCEDLCKTEPDPCAGFCSQQVYCSDTHPEITSCPSGSVQVGNMTVGANTCIFCETCDYTDAPSQCKKIECNCHTDCGDCYDCSTDGQCVAKQGCLNEWHCKSGGGNYEASNAVLVTRIRLDGTVLGPALTYVVGEYSAKLIDPANSIWNIAYEAPCIETPINYNVYAQSIVWTATSTNGVCCLDANPGNPNEADPKPY